MPEYEALEAMVCSAEYETRDRCRGLESGTSTRIHLALPGVLRTIRVAVCP